jgi:hypothetical protein
MNWSIVPSASSAVGCANAPSVCSASITFLGSPDGIRIQSIKVPAALGFGIEVVALPCRLLGAMPLSDPAPCRLQRANRLASAARHSNQGLGVDFGRWLATDASVRRVLWIRMLSEPGSDGRAASQHHHLISRLSPLNAVSLSAIAVQFEKQFPVDAGAGVHGDVLGEHMGRIHIGEYCSGFCHHDFVVTGHDVCLTTDII